MMSTSHVAVFIFVSRKLPKSQVEATMPAVRLSIVLAAFVAVMLSPSYGAAQTDLSFEVTLAPGAVKEPVDGRLFVFLSKRSSGDPMSGLNWFAPEPFFATDVRDFAPGKSRAVDRSAAGFPKPLAELEPGKYRVQALLDQDFYYPDPAVGPGNIFSTTQVLELDPSQSGAVSIVLDQIVDEVVLEDTKWVKFIQRRSDLLSDFHGREVIDRAAVVLPATYYDQPQRRYPVYLEVSGFGGSIRHMPMRYMKEPPRAGEGEVEFIHVMLSGECKWGHHVYANSATNGPRGDALVQEMIPYIDEQFRTVADPRARFVGGHSSGGWSSLWLQVTYPETFGGVWSTSPDPVDFRDWQQTNLYADPPESVFVDPSGARRPLARRGNQPILWYDNFCKMDDVLGRGGQLASFEAVFSPLDESGEPARCWDRSTGRVNPKTVGYWKQYDISLILEENWERLKEPLAGKLNVWMGDLDTFYLEGATRLMGERLKKLGSDAHVEIVPGKDHGSILSPQLRSTIRKEMSAKYLEAFTVDGVPRE
jgi:S-formylglutathione hydrolase FrmB